MYSKEEQKIHLNFNIPKKQSKKQFIEIYELLKDIERYDNKNKKEIV